MTSFVDAEIEPINPVIGVTQTNYQKVYAFHELFKVLINKEKTIPEKMVCDLRYNLIKEESGELIKGIYDKDIVEIADGIADTLYVVYGTGVSFGILMNSHPIISRTEINIFEEVEKLNLFVDGFRLSVEGRNLTNINNFLRGIVRVCYTIGKYFSIDVDRAFEIVHNSNMSKAHDTVEQARETQEFFLAKGVQSIITSHLGKFIVLRSIDNKILKSIYYTPADFSSMNLPLIPKGAY